MFVANKPIIIVNRKNIEKKEVSLEELRKYLPRYVLSPTFLYYGWIKRIWFLIIQWFLKVLVKILLRPRQTPVGNLDPPEVDKVYSNEAASYNRKHHLTTRGTDLIWRRMAGWFVVSIGRDRADDFEILDLCTGTGLTIKEIIPILKEWGICANITGLDYNTRMLAIAKNTIGKDKQVRFVQGNAMDLVADESIDEMIKFKPNSFGAVTQVFGIGGILEPIKVFEGVLRILNPGGQFFMIDTHKPIPEQPGEWPFLLRWWHFPIFEMVTYEESTTPLVLNRLWAWRDATASFYLLPLVTYQDSIGRYWGFEIRSFEQESQRWWFALPLMPIGKIIVEKIEINEEIAKTRKTILEACILQ